MSSMKQPEIDDLLVRLCSEVSPPVCLRPSLLFDLIRVGPDSYIYTVYIR
jgi:hypothetical protein